MNDIGLDQVQSKANQADGLQRAGIFSGEVLYTPQNRDEKEALTRIHYFFQS